MSAVNNLLDKYREKCSLASDSALASSLHMSRQGVHQWRRGLSWPSEDHIIKMAAAINEPAERWFVAISADKASPAGRKIWMRLAQAAAAVVIMFTFGHIDGHSTQATALAFAAHNPGTVYIMSIIAVASVALGTILACRRSCLARP